MVRAVTVGLKVKTKKPKDKDEVVDKKVKKLKKKKEVEVVDKAIKKAKDKSRVELGDLPEKTKKAKDTEADLGSQIKYESDDVLVVKHGTKTIYGTYIGRDRILREDGVEKDDADSEEMQVSFKPADVLANLGKKPNVGSVYGLKIEPFIRKLQIPFFGEVRVYRENVTKENVDMLKSCAEAIEKIFKKHRITKWLDHLSHTELRSKKGKYAGSYTCRRSKDDPKVDSIALNNIPLDDRTYLEYVLIHECTHGVWFRQVPDHLKAKWSKLYSKRIERKSYDQSDLRDLLHNIKGYDGSIHNFIKEMADDTQRQLLKEIYSYIKRVHKLDRGDVDTLVENDRDALETIWPEHQDISNETNDVGSEYALTNVREFFAETMTFHLLGRKLPKDVTKGCEATLQKVLR
jgi:hypothetical protein